MAQIIYPKGKANIFASLFLVALALCFTSCNRRQARIVGKIAHDIEHANGSDRQEDNSSQPQQARYSIRGVVQYSNGRVVAASSANNGPILMQEPDGLYLGNYIHRSPVYNNDVATITEVYDLPDNSEYENSFGETATRAYDVESYKFVCPMDDRTYYFDVVSQLN